MIKLTNILNEIKVIKPSPFSKSQVIEYFIDQYPYMLYRISEYSTEKGLVEGGGYDSLDDLLMEEWSLHDSDNQDQLSEDGEKVKQYVQSYYSLFKPKEIYFAIISDQSGVTISSPNGYKNIEIDYLGSGEYYVYCHN